MRKPKSYVEKPLVVSVNDACRLIGCGRTTLYRLLPELQTYTEGPNKRMISMASIEAYIAKRLAEQQKKAA